MGGLTSPKTYATLAAFQAVDAVACAIPVAPVAKTLDTLPITQDIRWLLPASKAASVIGLLAVGAHLRVRDRIVNAIPAASFLATYAALTWKGPDPVSAGLTLLFTPEVAGCSLPGSLPTVETEREARALAANLA